MTTNKCKFPYRKKWKDSQNLSWSEENQRKLDQKYM